MNCGLNEKEILAAFMGLGVLRVAATCGCLRCDIAPGRRRKIDAAFDEVVETMRSMFPDALARVIEARQAQGVVAADEPHPMTDIWNALDSERPDGFVTVAALDVHPVA